MIVLGIETSCDETAAAIVSDDWVAVDGVGGRRILANRVLSQTEDHEMFGGVVPEVAARAHLTFLAPLIAGALRDAGLSFADLNGVAATCGPGLIGGVMIGMMEGKAIAAARGLPFVAVNHLEAHALTARLTDDLAFPYLLLLASGGHTQLLAVEGVGRYRQYGATLDDALGECFDKTAKLLGLPFPGGPHLERLAAECSDLAAAQARFPLPRPLLGRPGCDFSFSGMKTAVRTHVDGLPLGEINRSDAAALAAALQTALADAVADRTGRAIVRFLEECRPATPTLVAAGGVAANRTLRATLAALAAKHGMNFCAPPGALCADNGAMIAWAGIERLRLGLADGLDVAARPRWPLEELRGAA